ncbi:MAG: hypothetical protein R3228_17465 [Halioglobus sp.]|nr:hypothetical protein [Halioglobus sp.]
MNWDAVGAVAELLGSMAVVVTLVFMLRQLRTSSIVIENATAQGAADAVAGWARQLTENPELYRIYRQGLKDDTVLSREERGVFDLILFQAFNSISSIYLQYRNGGFTEERWESEMRKFAANFDNPGGRRSWERQRNMLDNDFQREIERQFYSGDGGT